MIDVTLLLMLLCLLAPYLLVQNVELTTGHRVCGLLDIYVTIYYMARSISFLQMMLVLCWYFFVLLNAYYGGAMTMFFTSESKLPFETERDVIKAYPEWNIMLLEGNDMLFKSRAISGDQEYVNFVDRLQENHKYSSVKEGLRKLLEGQNIMHVSEGMLNGYLKSNPFHQQKLKTITKDRKSTIEWLIFPLNSPVREVMRLASSRLFENGAVEYLVRKWEGEGMPETKGEAHLKLS